MKNRRLKLGGNSAVISPCRRYRYALWRIWQPSSQWALFVGLNPSTADEMVDDATVRRCMGFAKRWGYGGIAMANLFGIRSRDPRYLRIAEEPVGAENDYWLEALHRSAGITLAAWGNLGELNGRATHVLANLSGLYCLGVTGAGHPRHPLYLPATARRKKFI